MTFGELLKQRMIDAKITQTALGRSVGVHRTTISDYILDKYLPTEETFHRIHQVFPDKELYDTYFTAVKGTQPRKNKQMIPEATPYNYYKAITEKVGLNQEDIKTDTKAETDDDDKYIIRALQYMLNHFKFNNIDQIAPGDYMRYQTIFNKYMMKQKGK